MVSRAFGRIRSLPPVALGVAALCAMPRAQAQPTVVLMGARIFTADSTRPWAEAVALRGPRIVAVGTNAEVARLATGATRRIEVGGRVIVPGFNDAHAHLGCVLDFMTPVSVADAAFRGQPFAVIADSLRSVVARVPPSAWIGVAIGRTVIQDTSARRQALDRIAPRNPVAMFLLGGHGLVLNSAALHALGIDEGVRVPLGGGFEREPGTRRLTGSISGYAVFALHRRLCSMDAESTLVNRLRQSGRLMARQGITSVQTFTNTLEPSLYVRVFRTAALPQRIRLIPMPMTSPSGRLADEWRPILASFTPPTDPAGGALTMSGWKWVLDGSPVEDGIVVRHAYASRPGHFGTLHLPPDTIRAALLEARASHQQIMFHTAGDSTAALVLSLLEQTGGAPVWAKERVRIEHGPGLLPDLLDDARRLGVVVVQNPIHLGGPLVHAPYDSARAAGVAPLRSLIEQGIPLAFGADEDGEAMSPFFNIMLATTHPANPNEAVTREQAVIAYTRGSAFAEMAEGEKGSLTPGMLADLVVLSQDIFSVPTQALPATHSVLTMIGGRIVYDELASPTTAPPRFRPRRPPAD
jgi:predicted amidohydrolase YtcJ